MVISSCGGQLGLLVARGDIAVVKIVVNKSGEKSCIQHFRNSGIIFVLDMFLILDDPDEAKGQGDK
jgi:hypothetical protein